MVMILAICAWEARVLPLYDAREVAHFTIPSVAWLLFLANIFWAMAYGTEYAMVERDDDFKIGIKLRLLPLAVLML